MKLGTKITFLAVIPVAVALAAVVVTVVHKNRELGLDASEHLAELAQDQAVETARSAYLLCTSTEARNQKDIERALTVAHDIVAREGGVREMDGTVAWQATNQFTKQAMSVTLRKVGVGERWLGQSTLASDTVPAVDEVTRLTGSFCTIFQRMNDSGDMLRVATSVRKSDGNRALGTYIPARNPDGTANAVVQSVLRGETFRGRAFVVNDWHAAAYEPIWDAGRRRVVGMLYVGVPLGTINKELRDAMLKMLLGETGGVYVLGGKGDQLGRYIISPGGTRDGEDISGLRDSQGAAFAKHLVDLALASEAGKPTQARYLWTDPADKVEKVRLAAVTYFAPWDWVIVASAYESDFAEVRERINESQESVLTWILATAAIVAVLSISAGVVFSRRLSKPLAGIISNLHAGANEITEAATHVASASQGLSSGSSEQAASAQETAATMEELSSMTKANDAHVQSARAASAAVRAAADSGAGKASEMQGAMRSIQNAANEITKILRTIDDIAFQTNILALNAAVEAARAGEQGAGFAVVAEEVRALSQRCAAAAKETGAKFEHTINQTEQGAAISNTVAANFADIQERIKQLDGLVADIAAASSQQSQGIEQVNTAVATMEKVIHSNASTAQETAAAAEELSSQTETLRSAANRLQFLVDGRDRT